MVIDAHIGPREIGNEYMSGDVYPPESLLESMDRNRIEASIVFPMRSAGKYDEHSRYILDSCKKYSARLIPFVRLNPWKDGPQSLREAFEKGFRGLKLHPNDECFVPNDLLQFLEVAEKAKNPVIFHSHHLGTEPPLIGDLAEDSPTVPIMSAHMGTDLYQDSSFVARKWSNVYWRLPSALFFTE